MDFVDNLFIFNANEVVDDLEELNISCGDEH
jgi:hypothetical protein